MVDNFELLAEWIRREKTFAPGDVLFLQIIQRRKDIPDLEVSQRTIRNIYLSSADDLMARKPNIVDWCDKHTARAYLRLNLRNEKKIALRMMSELADRIVNEQYRLKNLHESVMGQYHQDPRKTWIIDIDYADLDFPTDADDITDAVSHMVEETHREPSEILKVPTKNGFHLITPPFNKVKLQSECGWNLSIHADNPTILYIP